MTFVEPIQVAESTDDGDESQPRQHDVAASDTEDDQSESDVDDFFSTVDGLAELIVS